MGTDNLLNRRKNERQKRLSKERKLREETWLIVCEGTKTEPNYFSSLINEINKNRRNKIKYKIISKGYNTKSLVNSVDELFNYYDELNRNKIVRYGKIFVVFDKDDFSNESFNSAVVMCKKRGYISLWSNQCIEVWFLLHFNYLSSNISRSDYIKKLEKILKIKYQKNDDHFQLIGGLSNIEKAIENSKKLYNRYSKNDSPSNMSPCTTIFRLLDELDE